MPFKSAKQKRMFEAIAHGAKMKKKGLPSKKVAQKFVADADADEAGKQLENRPVIFSKGPIAQADPVGRRKKK